MLTSIVKRTSWFSRINKFAKIIAFLIGYNYPQLAKGDKRAEIITSIILQLLFSQSVFGKPMFKKKNDHRKIFGVFDR